METQDLTGRSSSVYVNTSYDASGRVSFQSFPSTSATSTSGVETSYDALGRVIRTYENVSPTATTTTEYLTGNQVRVTDALGNITTTTRSGYGSPEDGNPIRIDQPEGITTRMVYDIYGNLTSATQDGQTQSWTYDSLGQMTARTYGDLRAVIYKDSQR